MSMKYYLSFILLNFIIVFLNPLAGQLQLTNDPAKVQNNILDVNYFNEIWLKSSDINPSDVAGYVNRAAAKIEKGYYEEAYKDIDAAIKINPDYSFPYFLKGVYFLGRNATDSAEIAFHRSLKNDSLNTFTLFYIGLTRIYSKDSKTAMDYFTKINNKGDDEYLGYYGMAMLALKNYDLYECEKKLRRSLKINPKFIQAAFNLGLLGLMNGKPNIADNYMDQVIALDPGFAPAFYLKGIIRTANKLKAEEAITFFDRAIELDPENYLYLKDRASAYMLNDQIEKAFADRYKILHGIVVEKKVLNGLFKRSIGNPMEDCYFLYLLYNEYNSLFKFDNRPLLLKFLGYFFDGNYAKAQLEMLKVQKSDDNAITDIFLGLNYERQGSKIVASEYYQRAKNKSPKSYHGFLRSGILNYKLQNYNLALDDLNQTLTLNDTVNEAYWWRGFTLYSLEKTIDAIRDLNVYISNDSTDVESRFTRASIRMKADIYSSALKDLNCVLFYKEDYQEAIRLKVECLYNLENYKGVIEFLKKLSPEKITLEDYRMLGYSYMQAGQFKEASESLTRYIAVDGLDLKTLTWRGNCYFSLANYSAAADDFTRCIKLNSSIGVLYYLRGSTYLKMKNISAACTDFRTAELKGYKVPINFRDTCGN